MSDSLFSPVIFCIPLNFSLQLLLFLPLCATRPCVYLAGSAVSPPLCLQAMCASLALCQIVLVMCQPFQHSLPRVSLPMCPCVLFARLNWLFIYWTLLWLSKDWAYELLPDLPRRACKSHSAMLWSLQWMFFFSCIQEKNSLAFCRILTYQNH